MLSDTDRARIEAAVKTAELGTPGEIYCVVAGESSDYREVPIAWGAIAALAAPAVLLAFGIHVTAPDDFGQGWSAAQMSSAAEATARAASRTKPVSGLRSSAKGVGTAMTNTSAGSSTVDARR